MQELDPVIDMDEPGSGKVLRLVQQWSATGQAIEIMVNQQHSLRVGDETSVRMLLDLVDRLEMLEEVRRASQELDEGKGLSLEEARAQVGRQHGYRFEFAPQMLAQANALYEYHAAYSVTGAET